MPINKELKSRLQTSGFTQIIDDELNAHALKFNLQNYISVQDDTIKQAMVKKLLSSKLNTLSGYAKFTHTEFIIGVTQFIDNLIMKHGVKNIQMLEHDYKYYWRLDPNIQYSKIGKLKPNTNMIVGMPFPGHCCIHNDMDQIIEECNRKNIKLHLDCAWLGCAKNITFDFSADCIKSFGMSFSKAYGLGWNRIGIRWSKELDPTDSITIFNQNLMYNSTLIQVAYHYLKEFDIDYLWNKYGAVYETICKETYTVPTNIIWLGKDIKGNLLGMADALLDVGVSN